MSNIGLTDKTYYENIANSIRAKFGKTKEEFPLYPKDMAQAINNIQGEAYVSDGYVVTFISDNVNWAAMGAKSGEPILAPSSPKKENKVFRGWYREEGGQGEKITFPYFPNSNEKLYAFFTDQVVIGITGLDTINGTLTFTDDIEHCGKYSIEEKEGGNVWAHSDLDFFFPFNQIEEFELNGNIFIKFPKFWLKWIDDNDGNILGYKISNYQPDESYFIPDAFLDPNYTDVDMYLDYFALGKYEASGGASKIYSKSGQLCFKNTTIGKARDAARAHDTTTVLHGGYQLQDYAQSVVYNLLCMMYFQTANIQKVFQGRSKDRGVYDGPIKTGGCDTIKGLNGWNTDSGAVKLLGIENPYGNLCKWVDGVCFENGTTYIHRLPQFFSNSLDNSLVFGPTFNQAEGYLAKLKHGSGKLQSYVFPVELVGDLVTIPDHEGYYGDYIKLTSTLPSALYCGGVYYSEFQSGLWFLKNMEYSYGDSDPSFTVRLAYRPISINNIQ